MTRRPAPRFSWSKATARVAAPSRRATATPRRSCLARKNPERGQRGRGKNCRPTRNLSDLVQALGCGTGAKYSEADLRYERVIVMHDAPDVDGHIASLLLDFFLSRNARADHGRASFLAIAGRFTGEPGRHDQSMPAMTPTATGCSKASSAPAPRSIFPASRALGEMMPAAVEGNHHEAGIAHADSGERGQRATTPDELVSG